jgi:hypothetical protein
MIKFIKIALPKTAGFCVVCFTVLFFGLTTAKAQIIKNYTASGTWVCPVGTSTVLVKCWGAGGGGGGTAGGLLGTSSGGGGGGGGYASSVIAVTAGTVYNITVGTAGTAGAASATTAGNGEASWFNTAGTVFAAGGTGGTGCSTSGSGGAAGVGGTANIGTTTQNGGNGAAVGNGSSGGGGGGGADGTNSGTDNGSGATAGAGGTNNGGAGGAGAATSTNNGNSANTYGGGGGGGCGAGVLGLGGASTGGAGAAGYITLTYTCSAAFSGTYSVGGASSPNFTTLSEAFATIDCAGLSGNVNLVLQAGYTSASETFPLTPSLNTGAYSVTIYPAASGLSITSSNAIATMNFSGSTNYIIDGRVNQAGATDLTIANTNTSGNAVLFINDASYNTVKYCNVQGVNTTSTQGVVLFSTANSTGNDHNTIDHCNIHDGATTPYNCVYSLGTAGSENDNNTITNNNIYNFYNNGGASHGIFISSSNTTWTISGNSCYQTVARVPTSSTVMRGIEIVDPGGNNYTIIGNYVGGSAPLCGGSALSLDAGATQDNSFYGIYVSSGVTGASVVQTNTVANITFGVQSATASTYSFLGLCVAAGYVDVSNNIIGGGTGTGSINLTYATASSQGFVAGGILSNAPQGNVASNTIGSFSISLGSTSNTGVFRAIECDGSLNAGFIISNNIIGGTTANSIQYASSAAPMSMMGIFTQFTNAFNVSISGNTIQNFANNSTDNSGNTNTYGVYNSASSALVTVTTNTIANLSTTKPSTSGIMGIYQGITTAGQTVSHNIIHDLSNTYSGAIADDVYGIYFAGPTTGTNLVTANAIYNLGLSGTNTADAMYGIYIASGLATTSNNMITLGNGVTIGYTIYGIYDASSTNGNTFYFNSVYIGGTVAATGANTQCYYSSVTKTRTVENNIFYNARTQSAGTGIHYAINVSSKTGLTSNYNDLFSATDVGIVTATSYVTLANWQTGSGQDSPNSISSNPTFVSPTSATPSLDIQSGSPVVSVGVGGTGITIDFHNYARSTTPDIGAHEFHISYYSKSAGNLDLTTSWGLNTDGSGTNPPNFTNNDLNFFVQNNATPTIGGNWAVTGSGNSIILGDGTNPCNFTIPASFTCTGNMDVSANATLTNQNTINPTFVVLDANSTVNYNSGNGVNQTVSTAATYGNLILSNVTGSGTSTKLLAANVNVVGNLTINAYATFDIVTYNANRTGGGGTLTLAANGGLRLSGTTGGAGTTNNFPNNFSTMTLASTGTVEYYGGTQSIYFVPTYGNLTISTTGTKTAEDDITVLGALTINSPATFAPTSYNLFIGGNFANSGTFTYGTSTANFNGSAAQTINGSTATTFFNLTINNTSGGVTLANPTSIFGNGTTATSGALTLTSGLLNTDATNLLIMQNAATAPALTYASTSFVNGPMQFQKTGIGTTTLNFPVGATADCRPIVLTVNHSTATQYNYTAQLFNANPWTAFGSVFPGSMPTATVDTISGVHYWTIARTDAGGTSQPTAGLGYSAGVYPLIQLYFGINDFVYQGANVTIVKNTAATPANWIDIGATCALGNSSSPQAGSITSTTSGTPFNSFSSFSLASKNTGWNPLPIELLSFDAIAEGDKVGITWETVTETNNAYFTIEKSNDGKTFTKLMDVQGAGNSTSNRYYAETDYEPYDGTSYYRLKQTDYNGKTEYFTIDVVTLTKNGQQQLVVYPNPIDNTTTLNVSVTGYKGEEVLVVLRDIQGKDFLSKVLLSQDDDHVFVLEDTKTLPTGVYIITASSNNKIYNYKLIVR